MKIVSRKQWGARHADGFGSAPIPCRGLVLHHSVTPAKNGAAAVRTLENIGQERFGGGISYSFAVTPDGTVYEGHSIRRRGAHTKGMNSTVRAVVLIGNYDVNNVPEVMLQAVADLLVHGKKEGWWPNARLLGGHKDFVPGTACPGRHAHAKIGHINNLAAGGSSGGDSAGDPVLRVGDSGPKVEDVQNVLIHVGHDIKKDGQFGEATENALKDFQKHSGLTPDGIVGEKTWAALRKAIHGDKKPAPKPKPKTPPVGSDPPLKKGDRGHLAPRVKDVQRALVAAGNIDLAVNGIFDDATDLLIRKFQDSRGIKENGVVGPLTWAALRKVIHK